MGIVVGAATEVLPERFKEVEAASEFSAYVDMRGILGVANMDGTVKTLLDIDRGVTAEEIADREKAA
jgi:purine-binding chemotaxis protein CheW